MSCSNSTSRCRHMNDCCYNNLFELLSFFHKICNNISVNFILYAGSLLGAVREGNIIQGDTDVDVIIDEREYGKILNQLKSCKYHFVEYNDSNPARLNLSQLNMLHLDIWIARKYDDKNFYLSYCQKKYIFPYRFINETIKSKIKTLDCLIPDDNIVLLNRLYGDKWNIPNVRAKSIYRSDFKYE
jgi:lipopolysaccharide cholinephosphotransferase